MMIGQNQVTMQAEHTSDCFCESCLNVQRLLNHQNDLIAKNGYLIHLIPDDSDCPYQINVHTHGLWENYQHLDIQVCLRLPMAILNRVMGIVADKIKQGERFVPDKRYMGIIETFPVMFVFAYESDRVVLRMLLPNANGSFMGELQEQAEATFLLPAIYRRLVRTLHEGNRSIDSLSPKYDTAHVSALMMAGVVDFAADSFSELTLSEHGRRIYLHLNPA